MHLAIFKKHKMNIQAIPSSMPATSAFTAPLNNIEGSPFRNAGLADPLHAMRFADDLRGLMTHNTALSVNFDANLFFNYFEKLIADHCYRVGIVPLQVHDVSLVDWVQSGVRFEAAQWVLKIDIHRLSMLPGSTIYTLVSAQLRKAEIAAILIGQQPQLVEAVQANSLITDEKWHLAKTALAPMCEYPLNRYLLQDVARNSPLSTRGSSLWEYLVQQPGSTHHRIDDSFDAIIEVCDDSVKKLNHCIKNTYLMSIRKTLAENYDFLSRRLTAGTEHNDQWLSPSNAQRMILPPLLSKMESMQIRPKEYAPLFFSADEHFEQIKIITFLDQIHSLNDMDIPLNNFSQSLAVHQYQIRREAHNNQFESNLWLMHVKHLPLIPITPEKLTSLINEITNDAVALLACRDHYRAEFQRACIAVNTRGKNTSGAPPS